MSADRELLEAAARAAGIDAKWRDADINLGRFEGAMYVGLGSYTPQCWSPLTDDGDALRLLVSTDIEVFRGNDEGPSVFAGYWTKSGRWDVMTRHYVSEPIGSNKLAATRRAIVRAAAALGGKGGA